MTFQQTETENNWTANALRILPPQERDAILARLAERAEKNAPLTDFEAYGEDDLHGESTAAPAG